LKFIKWALLFLIFSIGILRFIGLEKSPPGFHNDEAFAAAHVMCLAQTGHDIDGVKLPLFSQSGAGGLFTPFHMYLAVVWSKFFGTSIAAFRALSACVITFALLGLFLLASLFINRKDDPNGLGQLYVVLAASLSPWAWQFSRMACDDPTLLPFGVIWGTYFFLRSNELLDGVFAALFYSIAMYSYPPCRVQIPLLVFAMLALKHFAFEKLSVHSKEKFKHFALFTSVGVFLCVPLVVGTLAGPLMDRFRGVALRANSPFDYTEALLRNISKHLSWTFLMVSGDSNLRHSSQITGELSYLDAMAIVAGTTLLLFALYKRIFKHEKARTRTKAITLFLLFGFLSGILPASLTDESLPHALRSVGAWPFISLITGFALFNLSTHFEHRFDKIIGVAVIVISVIFGSIFFTGYFNKYAKDAPPWYDIGRIEGAQQAAKTNNWESYIRASGEDINALGYYMMHYGGKSCDETRETITRVKSSTQPSHAP